MPVLNDFTLDTTNLAINHTSGTTVYTTNQLYSQIQDWMDDPAYMDFPPPMSAQTPTDYSVINGWFLNENCIPWLQGGAIKTVGYNTVIYMLTFGGTYTPAVAGDVTKVVTNGSTHTGTLLAYDNTAKKWWVRATLGVFTTEAVTITPTGTGAGTITAVATGENIFPNIYTLGSIDTVGAEQQIYIVQNKIHLKIWGAAGTADPTPAGTQHIDVLVKTQEAGTPIDSGNLEVFLRNYPSGGYSAGTHDIDLYDDFILSSILSSRNAVPLATSNDLNNTVSQAVAGAYAVKIVFVNGTITYSAISGPFTALETVSQAVSGATGVFLAQTTTTGAGTMTLGNVTGVFNNTNIITGGTSAATATSNGTLTLTAATRVITKAFALGTAFNYSVIIDCGTLTVKNTYEYCKNYTRYGATGSSFYTYQTINNSGPTVTVNRLDGEQYIQAFIDNVTPANTFPPVKPAPFGTFAGGKFFGATGVWLQNMASSDIQAFSLIDSTGATRNPPNQQTLTISNLAVNDAVGVFQTTSGVIINKNQFTMTVQSTSSPTVIVSTTIPNDTPLTGYIRVVQASGAEQRYYYASWTGSTFTLAGHTDNYGTVIPATTSQAYTASDHAYVPFIDDAVASGTSVSVTVQYVSDRTIVVRVRRFNHTVDSILPFEAPGTFTSTGYSSPAIRTSDTIVT